MVINRIKRDLLINTVKVVNNLKGLQKLFFKCICETETSYLTQIGGKNPVCDTFYSFGDVGKL